MNLINKSQKNMKILVFFVFSLVTYVSFAVSEIEALINNYYSGSTDNIISMRDTKKVTKPNVPVQSKAGLKISNSELDRVANRVYMNETGGKKENLVVWNSGESFPSLGIGHFIWMRAGQRSSHGESFPELVEFYREQGVKLPKILERNVDAPWKSRAELVEKKSNGDRDIIELIEFFDKTRDIQIMYIFERLEASLGKMMNVSSDSENVRYQFYRVANSPNGLYALIDYVNFKGEGLSSSQSWGLRNVLERMKGKGEGKEALVEFSNSAKYVLERRVRTSSRNEVQWLAGWTKRVESYKN